MRRGSPGLDYIQHQPPALYIHNPSASLPCDEIERRYFELFHEEIRINFCGYFGTPFWTQLVSRECHHEPAIRHAIFAFAALCKSSRCNGDTAIVPDEHLNFALVQYGKAVRSLRQNLAEGVSCVRLALIASVLFGWFESFYGNWKSAAQQIRGGLNILRHLKGASNINTRKQRMAAQGLNSIDPELSHALGCLRVHLILFLAMNPLHDYPFDDSEDQAIEDQAIEDEAMMQNCPSWFATLNEAFPSALSISMRSILLLRRCSKYTNSEPSELLRFSITRQQENLSRAVDQWNKAFHPILIDARQNMISRTHLKVLELHISIVTAKIIILTNIYREEITFDKYTLQFQYIVSISRRILEKEQEFRVLTDPKAQLNVGMIMALYYTATRCRDPFVRRDAIAVLKEWPSRYGIWDSWQAAKVAEWILRIEEEGCDSYRFIPEERRVRMTSLNMEVHSGGRISVECTQGPAEHVLKLWKADLL